MQIKFERRTLTGKSGGYSLMQIGTFQGRPVAVKRIYSYNGADQRDDEEKALQQLSHPNIVKLFHVEKHSTDFKYFALELCDASLNQLFLDPYHPRKYKGPELPHLSTIFLQLASGIEYLHSKNVIHGDIKPENALIYIDSLALVTIKWADFGLSKSVKDRTWFAPELLKLLSKGQEPGRGTDESDVFSLGLVFTYLLLDGQHLYGCNDVQIYANIVNNVPINMDKIGSSHFARKLVHEMLADNPDNRISSSDVVDKLQSIEKEMPSNHLA